jgi:hypothetical protein
MYFEVDAFDMRARAGILALTVMTKKIRQGTAYVFNNQQTDRCDGKSGIIKSSSSSAYLNDYDTKVGD